MAKSKRKRRRQEGAWTSQEHLTRKEELLAGQEKRRLKKKKQSEEQQQENDQRQQQQGNNCNNKMKKSLPVNKSALLSHDTPLHLESKRMLLNVAKLERYLSDMENRLVTWDDQEEIKRDEQIKEKQKRIEAERIEQDEIDLGLRPKRIKRRLGPETWKLRGAARPAWEVYDFDVRYINPHEEDMKRHDAKMKRIQNAWKLNQHQFLSDNKNKSNVLQEALKTHVKHSLQLGFLYWDIAHDATFQQDDDDNNDDNDKVATSVLIRMHDQDNNRGNNNNNKYLKKAYKVFNKIMTEMDFIETTNAQKPRTIARLIVMQYQYRQWHYYQTQLQQQGNKKTKKTKKLLQKQTTALETMQQVALQYFPNDSSPWISFTMALVQYEINDTTEMMVRAIHSNIYCAHYLAHRTTIFDQVMEYTSDVDLVEAHSNPLLEAIEYCNHSWGGRQWTESAVTVLRTVLEQELVKVDETNKSLDWETSLNALQAQTSTTTTTTLSDNDQKDNDEEEEDLDVNMYIEMFRTAMEMLQQKE